MLLACGVTLSSTGAGVAISAAVGSRDAAQAQYGDPGGTTGTDPGTTTGPGSGNEGTNGQGGSNDPGSTDPPGQVLGVNGSGTNPSSGGDNGAAGADAGNQTTRQVAASGGNTLPFTGYAGLAGLVLGLVMLGVGLTLRRTTTHRP